MSDFDDVLEPENTADRPATKLGRAERKRPVLKGDPVEQIQQLGFEQVQHPGRLEGGKETVLRPEPKKPAPSDAALAGIHARDEQRAEFLLAAHAARIARSLVMTYAQTPQRDRGIEEGHKGISRAFVHLNMAMHLGDLRQAPMDAVADAYVNCIGLLAELRHLEPDSSAAQGLSKLLGRLHQETELKVPTTPEEQRKLTDKHAPMEANARVTVVTAPLQNASLVLSMCVDDFLATIIHPERVDRHPNAEKGPKFNTAAKKAAILVQRAVTSCLRPELQLDPENPEIDRAIAEYRAHAKRFLNWAIVETLDDDVLSHTAAALIEDASKPLFAWCGANAFEQPRPSKASNAEQDDSSDGRLDQAWNKVFHAQHSALSRLATATKEEYERPWSERLFASIVKVGLATLVGGPAGAAGAIAATFHSVSDKPTRRDEAIKGGFANAIESLVGAAINEAVDSAAKQATGDTRQRFFHGQMDALDDAQELLANTVLAAAKNEAKRSDNPARALQNLTNRLKRSADEIGKQQAQRAVQDWFSYCARASHGVDKESGGADMTGVGGDASPGRMVLGGRVPDGVLELEIKLDERQPRIAGARVGSMRKDDVDLLKGIRVRDVRMPIQFRIVPPDGAPPAVVSRNEAGVLWLRAADDAAREQLVRRVGGRPDSDADVLRAATIVVHQIADHAITDVGGAE